MELKDEELTKSFVLEINSIVGFWVVLQHTPLLIMDAPPLFIIFPPDTAEDFVILEGSIVDNIGNCGDVNVILSISTILKDFVFLSDF